MSRSLSLSPSCSRWPAPGRRGARSLAARGGAPQPRRGRGGRRLRLGGDGGRRRRRSSPSAAPPQPPGRRRLQPGSGRLPCLQAAVGLPIFPVLQAAASSHLPRPPGDSILFFLSLQTAAGAQLSGWLREELGKTAGDHSPLQHGHVCISLFFADARREFAGDSLSGGFPGHEVK
jgi:hypothetical protein